MQNQTFHRCQYPEVSRLIIVTTSRLTADLGTGKIVHSPFKERAEKRQVRQFVNEDEG
jgi:hypothetical protein